MENNTNEERERIVNRRAALRAIGAAGASLAAVGTASARPGDSNGNGKGRPSASATSEECEEITLSRNATGPREPVFVQATLSDHSAAVRWELGRGESRTFDVRPGEWEVETYHQAVAVETPTVSVERCEPEGATLTISEPRCGTIAFERNDAGPESVLVLLTIERPDGSYSYPEYSILSGQRREYELGAGTYTAHIDSGSEAGDGIPAEDVEVIGEPLTVSPCE